eukprot:4372442-Pyramimonas_sp.AAC.1
MEFGHGILDAQELCDAIPWLPLVQTALVLNFPPVAPCLGPLQCMAVGALARQGAVASPFEPRNCAVQGLRSGARFAKLSTHFVV